MNLITSDDYVNKLKIIKCGDELCLRTRPRNRQKKRF